MDAIIDLTSRAVALITIIQETLVKIAAPKPFSNFPFQVDEQVFSEFITRKDDILIASIFFDNGSSYVNINADESTYKIAQTSYCYTLSVQLIAWIRNTKDFEVFNKRFECSPTIPAPDAWRESIREILYLHKEMRPSLAKALQYLPLQVILALGAKHYNAHQQRLLQIWEFEFNTNNLTVIISENDLNAYRSLNASIQKHIVEIATNDILKDHSTFANNPQQCLLENEELLIKCLEFEEVPLTFQYIFDKELIEICAARQYRQNELSACQTHTATKPDENMVYHKSFEVAFSRSLSTWEEQELAHPIDAVETATSHTFNLDAVKSATDMRLWGLALSGGGIRSATFSLGILQGLAKKGVLHNFDYLSTVSGGGYIGSWLVSWIARNKSVIKISNRLNPEKSSDPMAEEVRPIRWLRMYSNYLTPTTGLMSTDSWTVGMTVIRNMLINQIVIAAILLSLISFVNVVFLLWSDPPTILSAIVESIGYYNIGALLLLIAAVIAGSGMRSYIKEKPSITNPLLKVKVTDALTVIACLAALMMSSWMYHNSWPEKFASMPLNLTHRLVLPTIVIFTALLIVYILGHYYKNSSGVKQSFIHISIDMFGSALASLTGVYLFVLLTDHTRELSLSPARDDFFLPSNLCFTILPPLVLEIFAITIVLRMALLGANFPDERREWWGRIGGRLHRVSLVWLLAIGIIYLGTQLIDQRNIEELQTTFAAGWGALLLTGLRAAYTFKTSGENTKKGSSTKILEILALIAPYIFGIGLFILVPIFLKYITDAVTEGIGSDSMPLREAASNSLAISILITVLLTLMTYLLGHRIGVNQFSLHFFYKNRLARAFLGATRLRHDRLRSANPFTGFDQQDDLKISTLKTEMGYFGPYYLINTTLNATSDTDLDRQDRQAESFIFSPEYCGFDFSRTRAAANRFKKSYDYAYRPTHAYAYPGGPTVGTAMAISGAAANPNQGYHSNAATAFLMTIFNIRLGWWIGNPRQSRWKRSDPRIGLPYTILNLIGKTDVRKDYVCLSDGGHFDNMGLYELIRRRCKYIVLCDGEQDECFSCEGLANAVRRCRIDFGVEIEFQNFDKIIPDPTTKHAQCHYRVGKIIYPGSADGPAWLIYIKSTIHGDEPVDIREYAIKNAKFPHQSTADQFFDEAQFESYRKLGLHIAEGL